jgi:hypothetical protein
MGRMDTRGQPRDGNLTHLNPITQVTQWVDLIVGTACFVADVTVGKVYLAPWEYQLVLSSIVIHFRLFPGVICRKSIKSNGLILVQK